MANLTVIIDLSPIVRHEESNDWRNVEQVVEAWRKQKDPSAVFYGVADNSLWYKMDDYGQRQLNDWQKRGRARSLPWADPAIIELAEANPDATVITSDLFRDHRRNYPWLQGSTRFVKAVIDGSGVTFRQLDFSPVPDHVVSMTSEDTALKPKGMTTPEARQALLHEWACMNPGCIWGSAPVIDDDPAYADGQVCCPECGRPARKAGARENTREIVVLLGGAEADRIPVAEGTSLIVGREKGRDRYDVRRILDDKRSRAVSREHLRLANKSGRLYIEELGSRNGTILIGEDGSRFQLQAEVTQVLDQADRVSIADDALQIRLSGKKRARGRYEPDLTIAPWAE